MQKKRCCAYVEQLLLGSLLMGDLHEVLANLSGRATTWKSQHPSRPKSITKKPLYKKQFLEAIHFVIIYETLCIQLEKAGQTPRKTLHKKNCCRELFCNNFGQDGTKTTQERFVIQNMRYPCPPTSLTKQEGQGRGVGQNGGEGWGRGRGTGRGRRGEWDRREKGRGMERRERERERDRDREREKKGEWDREEGEERGMGDREEASF